MPPRYREAEVVLHLLPLNELVRIVVTKREWVL
jgi:hypothetical protein